MTSHHHVNIKGYTAHATIKPRKPISMQDYSTAQVDALAARHNVIAAISALGDTTP
jgi:hypothetical protein